jgi:methenyltetrahydromethanopterin cyclohydrolase
MLSINQLAFKLAIRLIKSSEYYRVKVEKLPTGATVIDTGINAQGGYEAELRAWRHSG